MWKGGRAIQTNRLLEKVMHGDQEAFRILIDTYKGYLYRIIFPIVRHDKDTEDLIQEVFVKVYYALPQYQSNGFKTWLTTLAINHAIDFKRKTYQQREQVVESIELSGSCLQEPSPEYPLIAKETRELVRRRIEELPRGFRDVVYAYYITEMSYQYIAKEYNIEIKTVEMKLYRARKWMKKHWKEGEF